MLTDSINDIVEQAAGLLSPPDMRDWSPPDDAPPDIAERLEAEEYDRRAQARIDAYLADRSDRLMCLRAIRSAALRRAEDYTAQAVPWQRLAERQRRLAEYVERLARNVLVAERTACGGAEGEPYKVQLPNGVKLGLRITRVVQVRSLDDLPAGYARIKTEKSADKIAIKRALEQGQDVPGAMLGTNEHVDWGR